PSSSGIVLRLCHARSMVARGRWSRSSRISVPSSSGIVLRRAQKLEARAAKFHFSPLLIGDRSATLLVTAPPRIPARTISVPSSSGIVLRPRRSHGRRSAISLRDFSPLLIGDRSATIEGRDGAPRLLHFSPLLIGDRSATVRLAHGLTFRTEFQSPPPRGSFCDRRGRLAS